MHEADSVSGSNIFRHCELAVHVRLEAVLRGIVANVFAIDLVDV